MPEGSSTAASIRQLGHGRTQLVKRRPLSRLRIAAVSSAGGRAGATYSFSGQRSERGASSTSFSEPLSPIAGPTTEIVPGGGVTSQIAEGATLGGGKSASSGGGAVGGGRRGIGGGSCSDVG
eukprot:7391068-Prymnesium_polylepis.1